MTFETTRRFALLVGASEYEDAKLNGLPGAAQDLIDLAATLTDATLCKFTRVETLLNERWNTVLEAICDFATDPQKRPDDLLYVHISGHGVKDLDGRLYFACRDTKTRLLQATAVSARQVDDFLRGARPQRKLLVLDCCYGGAFSKSIIPKGLDTAGAIAHFPEHTGKGFVVISASDALQYAFERFGDTASGTASRSVFTSTFLEGIATGMADRDGDGYVGVQELFEYTSARISEEHPEQTPQINAFNLDYDILLARAPAPVRGADRYAIAIVSPEQAQSISTCSVIVDGKSYAFRTYPGMTDGSVEVFPGEGAPGENGGRHGDLLVRVFIRASGPPRKASRHAERDADVPDGSAASAAAAAGRGEQYPPELASLKPVPPAPVAQPAPVRPAQAPSVDAGSPPSPTKMNPKDGAQMIFIAPGPFFMGDDDIPDNPRRTVMLSGYYIYQCPVTVAMYGMYCRETGATMPDPPPWGWQVDCPMVNVPWSDAKRYCTWAGVELPTEAQWEKAARGVDGRKYPWGNRFDTSRLWCSRARLGDARSPRPVGAFVSGASPYDVLDMAGNVWEWCLDGYDGKFRAGRQADEVDPVNNDAGEGRVIRGGSWSNSNPQSFRAAYRYGDLPGRGNLSNGFRCVTAVSTG